MILKIKVYLFMKYKYTVMVYFFWKETSMKNIVNLDDLSLDEINDLRQVINDIDDEKYKNILSAISGVVNDMALKVEEIIVKQEAIEENMEYIGDDLTDMREELFEEVSFDDLENLEDEYEEIHCHNCGKPLFVERKAIENNSSIPCPFCNKNAK